MRKMLITSALAGVCFMAENGSGTGGGADRPTIIKDALSRLDVERDEDWTQGGLPDMARMKELTNVADLTRAEVAEVLPGFSREGARGAPSNGRGDNTTGAAAGTTGSGGGAEEHEGRRMPTAQEIAERIPDPLLLLEAAVAAANASDRHRRNGPLHAIVRHYMVDQVAIKDHQARLDRRQSEREAQAEAQNAAS